MYKFKTIKVENHEVELRIKDNKAKDTVLFIHGFNSSNDSSLKVEEISKNFNTISFSFPGSTKTKLNPDQKLSLSFLIKISKKILSKIKNSKVHIVGHSLGGLITCHIANSSVKSIKLVSPFHPYLKDYKGFKLLLKMAKKENSITKKIISTAIKALDDKTQKSINFFLDPKSNWYSLVAKDFQNKNLFDELTNKYNNNLSKISIIAGDKDTVISTKHLKRFADESNIPFTLVKSGHSPNREQPIAVNDFIGSQINYKKRFLPFLRKII